MNIPFETLLGKELIRIENAENESLSFFASDGSIYVLEHYQDWCENVSIEDICGDLDDLVGCPILLAEEIVYNQNVSPAGISDRQYDDSFSWTFYKLSTIKGSVTIRWLGESNGYYSEKVNFVQVRKTDKMDIVFPTLNKNYFN